MRNFNTLNSTATQRAVVDALLALLNKALPCRLLLSYRADFTGEAIEKPAQQQGMIFEAELAMRMIQDVGEEPGYLPLLQFALLRLWGEHEGTLVVA